MSGTSGSAAWAAPGLPASLPAFPAPARGVLECCASVSVVLVRSTEDCAPARPVLATQCVHHHQGADNLSRESRFAHSVRTASGSHLPPRIGDRRLALRDAFRGFPRRAQVAAAPYAMERGAGSHGPWISDGLAS